MIRRFWTDEGGMETVEWAVMAALIVAGVVIAVQAIGDNVLTAFNNLKEATTPAQ